MSKEGDEVMAFQRMQKVSKKPPRPRPFAMGWRAIKPMPKPKQGATK